MTDQSCSTSVDRLKRSGIGDDQVRAHAEAMDHVLREAVATKADIKALGVKIDISLRAAGKWVPLLRRQNDLSF